MTGDGNAANDYQEMSLTYFEHIFQQQIYEKNTQFSTTFAWEGWYKIPEIFDISDLGFPVYSHWLGEDAECDTDLNKTI